MGKTGLVVEGGGMRCAYNAGILDRFIDEDITFDYCIGVSAGAANTASFVARQRDRNIRFYTKYTNRWQYFGLRSFIKTGNLFGLDYIYGDMTNSGGEDPIDFEAMISNPAQFYVCTTDAQTGQPVYFSKDEFIKDNYCHIRATCAIPAACRPVEIDGRFYYDGGVSDSIPVQRALDDGCEKLVVILSKPRNFVRKPQSMKIFYRNMCRQYPEVVKQVDNRHIKYKEQQDLVSELEKQGKALVFAQDDTINVQTFGMNVKKEWDLYEMGIRHFDDRKDEVKKFLES